MSYQEIYQPYREEVAGRYPLVAARILEIPGEETVAEPFRSYFRKAAEFINLMYETEREIAAGTFFQKSIEELQDWNDRVYGDIFPGQYEESFGNPAYARKVLGSEFGGLLCMLYAEIRKMAGYAAENGIHVAVRGLRAITDFEYELQIAQTNRKLSDGKLDTVFLTTSLEYAYLSSSSVKEIASFGGDISQCVPEFVAKLIYGKYHIL